MTSASQRGSRPPGVCGAVVTLAFALAASACGGSGAAAVPQADTGTNASNPQAVAASQCMRAHGIHNFPDPVKGSGGGVGLSVSRTPGNSTITVGDIPFSGPAFTAAAKACRFGPYGTRPTLSAAQRRGMLENAECMRTHGVPNFPDPTFGPRGGVKGASSHGINTNAPAFIRANQKCNHVGVPLPGGG